MGHWACREHGPALAAAHTQGTLLVDVDNERERMNSVNAPAGELAAALGPCPLLHDSLE